MRPDIRTSSYDNLILVVLDPQDSCTWAENQFYGLNLFLHVAHILSDNSYRT